MEEMKNYLSQYQSKDSFKLNNTKEEMKNYWSQYQSKDNFQWNNTKDEMHNFCVKNKLYYYKKVEYKK